MEYLIILLIFFCLGLYLICLGEFFSQKSKGRNFCYVLGVGFILISLSLFYNYTKDLSYILFFIIMVSPFIFGLYIVLRGSFVFSKTKFFSSPNFHYWLGVGLILLSISIFYCLWSKLREPMEVCDVCHVNHEVQSYNMNVSNFQECKRNCLSIVKSLEDYGEKNNYYPSSLKELKPKYIKSVPTCPNHYWQYEYSTNSGKTMYTLSCGVNSHTDAGFPKDYPLFTGKIKKKATKSKK